jgi:hypothetical protein
MKRSLLTVILAGSVFGVATQAATIQGVVTNPAGSSLGVSAPVYLYKWNPESASYSWNSAGYTNVSTSQFAIPNLTLGSYLLVVPVWGGQYQGDPWGSYGWYYNDPLSVYYTETYNDVTALTPYKAPTQINLTGTSQIFTTVPIKLNRKTGSGCQLEGPITINGKIYNGFYDGMGPQLPSTGGTLTISYKLRNYSSTASAVRAQAVSFLTRRTGSSKQYEKSVRQLNSVNVSLPSNNIVTVNMTASIPSALMKDSAPFSIGLQTVDSNSIGVCNLATFPVYLKPTTATATVPSMESVKGGSGQNIPLTLDENGRPIEWGPMPANPPVK